MGIFMQDFALAFKEYISIRRDEDILVNIESRDDGYNIIFESSSESLINEIDQYKKDFEDFLQHPESQFSLLGKHVDKIENSVELMSLLYKIVTKLKIYKELGTTISGQSAFTLPSIILTENLSLTMSSVTNDFSKSTINNLQLNQADNISNPIQNNNHTTQEILNLLDKFLEYKTDKPEEIEALENIRQAKNELEKGNGEKAKSYLQKALFMFKDPAVQIALGMVTNYAFETVKPFLGLK